MPTEITMPQLSDTMTEGTIVKWLKKEGDKVKAGEIIAEVETDKATMEWEAPDAGTIASINAKEGEKVKVGGLMAVLALPGEDAASAKTMPTTKVVDTPEVADAAPDKSTSSPTEVQATAAAVATKPAVGNGNQDHGERVAASPLARKIAEAKGIDLHQLRGSGPRGRIVKADVESASARDAEPASIVVATKVPASASAPSVESLVARSAGGGKQVVALSKMRSVIAQRLQQSKQQVPHFYETVEIDAEALADLRKRMNEKLDNTGVRISIADFVAKAVAMALVQHRTLNSTFDGTNVTSYEDVHLGMAVALPEGLIVPVLRNINQMGLAEIRMRSADLVERARAQRLKRDELSGATFTVSNLGTYGVKEFSAIINPPEVGILAVAAAEKRAVVRNDQVVARTMMTVTLSADHRVVDGALAAEFLRTLKQLLEDPGMMLV